jgi:hypothetical protein
MDNRDVQVLLDRTTLGEFVNTASAYRRGKKTEVVVMDKNATLGDAMKVAEPNVHVHCVSLFPLTEKESTDSAQCTLNEPANSCLENEMFYLHQMLQ